MNTLALCFFFLLLPPTAHWQNKLRDFELVSNTADSRVFHTSKTKVYRHKADGTEWIVKAGPDRWLINEFVSGKIYQFLLGEDAVSNSIFVIDDSTGKRLLATQIINQFTPVNIDTGKMGQFPFDCALGNCECTPSKCQKKRTAFSTISQKPVEGFERAALATLFLDDDDIDGGNNFALVELDDKFLVTRFDFDDSLKFFDRLEITTLDASDVMPPEQLRQLAAMGMSKATFTAILKQQLSSYSNASPESLWRKFKTSAGVVNSERIQNALKELTGKPFSAFASIIDDSWQTVSQYYSDREIGVIYNTKKALCSQNRYETREDKKAGHDFAQYDCHLTTTDKNIAIIGEFTKFMLQRRYNDLKALLEKTQNHENL